jgi:pimeloyl-ACP methyl ester carboxylesterase
LNFLLSRRQALAATPGALVGLTLTGCSSWSPRPATRPLVQLTDPSPCASASGVPRPLVVLLPGRGMPASEFADQGLIRAIRRRGFAVDVLVVDAHLGYYLDRVVFEALREDIVAPARARGVREIWLVGISLGGYGALLYDARHPGEISGVVALAPYLGVDEVVDEVARAGSLAAWRPPAPERLTAAASALDTDRQLWRWMQAQAGVDATGSQAAGEVGATRRVPVFIGYGDRDRYLTAQRLAAAARPAAQVAVRSGAHDWPAWRDAWEDLLPRLPWPRHPDCV